MSEGARPVRLTVERAVAANSAEGPLTVRLSVDLPTADSGAIDPARVGAELAQLRSALDGGLRAAGLATPVVRERPLEELLETYRPRQGELVELLREDGEITEGEYARLRAHLGGDAVAGPGRAAPPESIYRPPPSPIAAAPLEGDRAPARARSIPELLEQYRIASLKQAGAVRARRQISFDEYMALKRHFSSAEGPGPTPAQ